MINKHHCHPLLHTHVCLLHYERICRRKLPRSGWKHTGLHVSASTGWKCTVQGQNATVQFGTNVCVQRGPFRVKMVVLYRMSEFPCHNVTIQGRKCTVPMKCNDALWHERWLFTRGQNHPSSVLARTTVEWKVLIGSFDYPTLLTLRQRFVDDNRSVHFHARSVLLFSMYCLSCKNWPRTRCCCSKEGNRFLFLSRIQSVKHTHVLLLEKEWGSRKLYMLARSIHYLR